MITISKAQSRLTEICQFKALKIDDLVKKAIGAGIHVDINVLDTRHIAEFRIYLDQLGYSRDCPFLHIVVEPDEQSRNGGSRLRVNMCSFYAL